MSNKLSIFNPNEQSLVDVEKYGQDIVDSGNNIFTDLVTFMENPISRDFYDKYICRSSERDSMLSYCWIYKFIESEACKNELSLTPCQKLALVQKSMLNKEFRPYLIGKYMKSMNRPRRIKNSEKVKKYIIENQDKICNV